jgi:hypothetical protein
MSDRPGVMMFNEGQLLQMAGSNGKEFAANYTRGLIDGAFNALMRFEDADDTAKYAFALADRIVGRVKEPTAWPLQPLAPVPIPKPVVDVKPPEQKPRRFGFWTIFAIGWVCGFLCACGVAFPFSHF